MSKVDFALSILKTQKYKDQQTLMELDEMEDAGKLIDKRLYTRLIHDVGSLDFSIEVLKTYTDDDS